MSYLIYSVEDDKNIANIIKLTLAKQGYEIKLFETAHEFFEAFNVTKPNLILLDMMLPDMSGKEILEKVKGNKENEDIRIIIISAKSMIVDKVEALDLGADDYISKPFDILELISRVNVQKRRQEKNDKHQLGNTIVDIKRHVCIKNGEEITLTKKEFDILALLLSHHDEVVTRNDLIKCIWGDEFVFETRTVDMHIKSLRKKLDDDSKHLETIYGVGYMVRLWEKN